MGWLSVDECRLRSHRQGLDPVYFSAYIGCSENTSILAWTLSISCGRSRLKFRKEYLCCYDFLCMQLKLWRVVGIDRDTKT